MDPLRSLLERARLRMDLSLRVRMTEIGYEATDGHADEAVEDLQRIERDARSVAVRGWANASQAFILLATRRPTEAEASFARHPEPSTQPLLAATIELANGRLGPGFETLLSDCRFGISAMGAARVVVDAGRLDEVIQRSLELGPGTRSLALLTLQAGLHLLPEYEPAIRVGELVWERQHWPITAYWVAVGCAATGDGSSAVTWLDRAADRGFSFTRPIDRDVRFDAIRQWPDFIAARTRVSNNPPLPSKDTAHGGLLWSGPRP